MKVLPALCFMLAILFAILCAYSTDESITSLTEEIRQIIFGGLLGFGFFILLAIAGVERLGMIGRDKE
jgi:hypothetical protein